MAVTLAFSTSLRTSQSKSTYKPFSDHYFHYTPQKSHVKFLLRSLMWLTSVSRLQPSTCDTKAEIQLSPESHSTGNQLLQDMQTAKHTDLLTQNMPMQWNRKAKGRLLKAVTRAVDTKIQPQRSTLRGALCMAKGRITSCRDNAVQSAILETG